MSVTYRGKEIQFGFQFPEYEYTEGDIVRLLRDELDHTPFIVTKRSFYDERSYRDRISDDSPDHLYTGWYYVVTSMNHVRDNRYYTDAVTADQLEHWKWYLADNKWEA